MVAVFERMSKQALRAARLLAVVITAIAPVTVATAAVTAGAFTVTAVARTASALAGDYDVYSCRTPSGESAPADGWSGSETGAESFAEDTCSQPGGALIAALGDQTTHVANADRATWTFEPPTADRLDGATLWRAGYLHGRTGENATYQFWLAGPIATDVFDECLYTENCSGVGEPGQPLSTANRLAVPVANLGSQLSINVSCATGLPKAECPDDFGDPNNYAAVVYLYAADLTLEQSSPPTASNVSGELASAPTVSGTSDVAFSASDPGSGVYEAVFSVDGQVVQSTVVDEDGGRCRNVGQTMDGLAAFLYVQPCPASVSADVGFDTTRVGNGEHHLVVSVIDAAGNAATVLDRNVTIDNPSPPGGPNGTPASARATLTVGWKATGDTGERLTSGYGHAQTIVGRLTGPGGVPIDGAQIEVLATPDYSGARAAAMASPRTDADGRFSVRLPADVSSRTLRFAYSNDVDSPPVVTRTLTLSVRAGVTLGIAPRTASVGSSIYFSGRLRGGPIPKGGKLLVLEARSPGGAWLEFDVIRSDARGRYHASYRFKFPGPAEYQFRVLCEAEADYPFATGSSNVVGVFER
jgi:hypothetical protein